MREPFVPPPGGRRAFLSSVVAGTALVAGCGSREPDSPGTTPDRSPGERTTTPIPDARTFDGAAVTDSGVAVDATWWAGFDRLRYRSDGGDLAHVTPDRGWFLALTFEVANRSDERQGALPESEFHLRLDGQRYEHIHSLSGDIAFDQLAQPDDQPPVRELRWYRSLAPGQSVSLQLVFETPNTLDGTPYLVWNHDGRVEGGDTPAYLVGERRWPE